MEMQEDWKQDAKNNYHEDKWPEGLQVGGEAWGGGDCCETEKGERGRSKAEKFPCMWTVIKNTKKWWRKNLSYSQLEKDKVKKDK